MKATTSSSLAASRDPDDRCLDDTVVEAQHIFYFLRMDHQPAALDQVGSPAGEMQNAVICEMTGVTRVIPAVADRLVACRGLAGEGTGDARPAHADAARRALSDHCARVVDNLDLDPRRQPAGGGRRGIFLVARDQRDRPAACRAVIVDDARRDPGAQSRALLGLQLAGGGDIDAQSRHQVARAGRQAEQRAARLRRDDHGGCTSLPDAIDDSRGSNKVGNKLIFAPSVRSEKETARPASKTSGNGTRNVSSRSISPPTVKATNRPNISSCVVTMPLGTPVVPEVRP